MHKSPQSWRWQYRKGKKVTANAQKSAELAPFHDLWKKCAFWTCRAQELSAEKSKVATVETRLSSQLSKREQEMIALQARMQASYQDHVAQTQALNTKVSSCTRMLQFII